MTGEIWESSLGFERPSFGPCDGQRMDAPGPGPCWGCLSICVSRASGASTVRLCHDAPTAGHQLGAFDLFSARHDPSAPAQPTLDAGRHGPILRSRVEIPEAGHPRRFLAGDLYPSSGSRRLQQTTSFCPSAVMENAPLKSHRRALLWQSGCLLPQRTLDIPKAPHIFKLLKTSRVLTGGCSR